MMDDGVLSGNEITTGFCRGGRATTAVMKASRRTKNRILSRNGRYSRSGFKPTILQYAQTSLEEK